MRIIQVFSTPWPPSEGIATYVHGLTRELLKRGHEVTLVTRGPTTRSYHDAELGAEIVEVRTPALNPFHVHLQEPHFRRLAAARWGTKDVVYHLHTPYPPLPPKGARILLTVHTPMVPDSASIRERTPYALAQKAQSRFLKHREQRILRAASVITAVSAQVAQELAEYGVDPAKVIVTGNAVDETRFHPISSPTRDYFLYAGRLGPRKGLEDLIEAARLLNEQKVDFELRITGKGPLGDMLRARVREHGLDGRVKFLGIVPKDELVSLYQNARAVVIPSHYEGLPTVLLEAMACGTPVVATDIPGIREVVGKAVRLVPPADRDALASAISQIGGQASQGGILRGIILEHFTWAALGAAYESRYSE